VLDPTHAVLLLVYSPRCGGSNAVQPVFKQLAEAVHSNPEFPNVRVARMDGTKNDFSVRGIKLSHYPTALLFPARNDGVIEPLRVLYWDEYNGSHSPHNRNVPHSHYEMESLKKFIKSHQNWAPSS